MMKNRVYSFAGLQSPAKTVMKSNEFADVKAVCSPQQSDRRVWEPVLPLSLRKPATVVVDESVKPVVPDADTLATMFPETWGQKFIKLVSENAADDHFTKHSPLRIGVVLSGGQAAGGHNVIAGIYDYIKQCNSQSQLIGFLNGPHGIFSHNYREITDDYMNIYRNMGGFDMICSGRHKIETEEQKSKSMEICQKLELHGLVIIGGDDSNTNGAILAEYFKSKKCKTLVVGAPKTIDGDLRNEYVETSFGFDTAVKVYSELIGNLCSDVATSQDRYHFVRLMGRSASNIALECALQTRANLTFIGEEILADNRSLMSIVEEICDMIEKRHSMKKDYGVILLPEGLIEFIPEVGALISEINDILADGEFDETRLGENSLKVFHFLPESIRNELLLERDSHGNVQVAKIATEKLLILMTRELLAKRNYTGSFIPTDHYFGYEGRCAMPSNFDANYCYALGHTAGALIDNGLTGYMAVVRGLSRPAEEWTPAGCPVIIMMNIERRKGKNVPVIKKYLVELDKPLYQNFKKVAEEWKYRDLYRNPGPIQFEGPTADAVNFTIRAPDAAYLLPSVPDSKCRFPKSVDVLSPLQIERLHYRPGVSSVLTNLKTRAIVAKRCTFNDQQVERFVRRSFPLQSDRHGMRAYAVEPCDVQAPRPLRVGVVLAGQPVPGAINVIQGLYERLSLSGGKLIGFKGITGLLEGDHILVSKEELSVYVNQGGFEMLGRTPETKTLLRNDDGIAQVEKSCRDLNLDGLVLIGGQTSLTDAAVITEHFLAKNLSTRVIGVPANQENNVKHTLLEAAIGFDTTSKSYSHLIGNLLTDAASATKYWYFVRLMGNVPSHIAMEAALQTHPNFTVVSERYVEENMSLSDVVRDIADVVAHRAESGKNYGTVVIPEGVISAIPQYKALLSEIDAILQKHSNAERDVKKALRNAFVHLKKDSDAYKQLTPWSAALLQTLPEFFRAQLVKETPTGRIELSEIGAEQLLAMWVSHELAERKKLNTYSGSFAPVCHYFGFQGRSAMPSNFDCALATAHGYLAAILVESDLTGFVTSVRGLCARPTDWRFTAVPLSVLMRIMPEAESAAYGRKIPMIPCADVDLSGSAYRAFASGTESWELDDSFCNPGPIQYNGVSADYYNRTLYEEQYDYISMLSELEQLLGLVGGVCSFGVNKDTLKTAVTSMSALATILSEDRRQSRND
eukprot:Blabericola_migrator_1__5487@NODE_27_length_20109_cov_273_259006_g24_i0_p3_GENE_NODE_27_length_20109_cov_273_259006_g24_i0NODE_27_length_20109_cov_273_259006_g24_i0_p3_ORF_typecomplete_len1196_score265_43PFK/PF00365_20/2_4e79PFK/PF00365_20/6_6e58RSS_P20/PF11757_8/1_1e03RSS_P20/PF11757_8/22RSS_P20/PF11757_8/24_NODE_27_length_20109_cov_273_259006_g24_i046108197